jgi:hypothetical protein
LILDGFFGPLTASGLAAYQQSDATDTPPEASPDSIDAIADFSSTIDRAQEFILINYVTLGKMMAHYVKQCGIATQFQDRLNQKLPGLPLPAIANARMGGGATHDTSHLALSRRGAKLN